MTWDDSEHTDTEMVRRLRAQLPAEMQDCTILFKECEVGHGRLTATNWIDHGCPHCKMDRLRSALKPLAAIPLWRDTYPDARLDRLVDEGLPFTAEQVRAARSEGEPT